jgi:acyl carrier protein
MSDAILPRVAAHISAYTGIHASTITLDSSFDTLGFDSLDRVELAMLVEDEFAVALPDGAEHDWKTVGDICGWVETMSRASSKEAVRRG